MSRVLPALLANLVLILLPATIQADNDTKPDLETAVAEGKEIPLTEDQITLSDKPGEDGVFLAMVKPGKASVKVKMPAQVYGLNVTTEAVKGGGLKVVEIPDSSSVLKMRTVAGKTDEGPFDAEPGDIITHVNGNAVNSVEELLAAVSTAKDKNEVQILLKDVRTGNHQTFYVTATKKK